MDNTNNYAEMLLAQTHELVDGLNKQCIKESISNKYVLEVRDGGKPLKSGGSIIKHYKTLELRLESLSGNFVLYIAHAPLKNMVEASRSKKWLLQLLRDLHYQMLTNYCIMAHASILERERKLRPQPKKVGSMIGLDGKPLTIDKVVDAKG